MSWGFKVYAHYSTGRWLWVRFYIKDYWHIYSSIKPLISRMANNVQIASKVSLILIYYIGKDVLCSKLKEHYTFVFHTFIMIQLFNLILCRHLNDTPKLCWNSYKNLHRLNPLLIVVGFAILIIQYLVVEEGEAWMSTTPLTWE